MSRKRKRARSRPAPAAPPAPLAAPSAEPRGSPLLALLCVLIGIGLGVFVVVALGLWGGVVGRVVIAAVGCGVVGLLAPFWLVFVVRDNSLAKLFVASAVLGVVLGIGFGVWYGLTEEELPWWAYATAGVVAAVIGGVGGFLLSTPRDRAR